MSSVSHITFIEPMPGFADAKNWTLGSWGEEETPFKILIAEDGPSFVIVEVGIFWEDLDITLNPETVESLEIKDVSDVALYAILTLGDDLESTTANLLGPIVINVNNGKALQFIRTNTSDSTKEPLIKK